MISKIVVAREILILFCTVLLILITSFGWHYVNSYEESIFEENIRPDYRVELYQKIDSLNLKGNYSKIIDINYVENFHRLIADTSINKKFYKISKELEQYEWNGKLYTLEMLKFKYGDSLNNALEKFNFHKKRVVTDLDYGEFNSKIQQVSSFGPVPKKSQKAGLFNYDTFTPHLIRIGLVIFIIAYPIRIIIYIIKWSLKEVK